MTATLDRPARVPPHVRARVRTWATTAVQPTLTALTVLAAMVLVLLVVSGVDLGAAPGAVAAAWLAVHQAPVTIAGSELGVLPMLPTALLVWFTQRSVAGAGLRGRACLGVAAAAVTGPVVVTAAACGVLAQAGVAVPVTGPPVAVAVLWTVGVHVLGAALGLVRVSGLLAVARRGVPGWAWVGVRVAPRVLGILLSAGTVLVVIGLASSPGSLVTLLGAGGGVGGAVGLVGLSLLYLPNAVLGAVGVLVGPGVELGRATVTVFGSVPGPVPPLPLLAALPEGTGAWWWLGLLLVPASLGVDLGRRCLQRDAERGAALRAVLTAAAVVGVTVGMLGAVAGGALGAGAFTPVGVVAPAVAAATTAWLGVVGAATVLVALLDTRRDVTADDVAADDVRADDVRADDVAADDGAVDDGVVDAGVVDAEDEADSECDTAAEPASLPEPTKSE